jgi:hypothetical protein
VCFILLVKTPVSLSGTVLTLLRTLVTYEYRTDRLCGLVVRVQFPALPEKKVVSLERGPLSLVSTTEELLDRNVAAPV